MNNADRDQQQEHILTDILTLAKTNPETFFKNLSSLENNRYQIQLETKLKISCLLAKTR